MSPVSTEVLDNDLKTVRDAVHAIDVRLGKFEARAGLVAGLFTMLGSAILGSLAYGLIWYGTINARFEAMGREMIAVTRAIEKVDSRLGAIESRLAAIDARLSSVEGKLAGPEKKPGAE